MTTVVKVEAHCSDDKQVHIDYQDMNGEQVTIIQNGEKWEGVIYDDKVVTVSEVLKV